MRELAKSARMRRLRRSVWQFAESVTRDLEAGGHRVDLIMVTTTYVDGWLWEQRQISGMCQRLSEWLKRRGLPHAYAWVIEMQKRGVPHYHVLLWVPRGTRLPKPDQVGAGQRKRFWPWGSTKIEQARKVGYIVKYATKFSVAHPLPRGARLFGVGGTERSWRRMAVWNALPKWIREASSPGDRVRPYKGGGYVNLETGEVYPPRWHFSLQRAGPRLWRVVLERIQTSSAAAGASAVE